MTEEITALTIATMLLLGSPGPAPLALAATGASHGFRKGIPFLAGILTGLTVAIIGAIAGLATLFATFPNIRFFIQLIGSFYIFYIAIKIATAPALSANSTSKDNAPTFIDGFILNLLNPKAYAAFFAIFSSFRLPLINNSSSYLATAIICLLAATVVDVLWLWVGGIIKPLFQRPREARLLRVTFAISMVVAVLVVFLQ